MDTGFIVYNEKNYPLLTALFKHLNVPVAPSNMSFGADIPGLPLSYSTQSPASLFAQKSNLLRPAFWAMLADILRFNRCAAHYLDAPDSLTLGQCLDEMKMGEWFRRYYLLAMGGAIWSTQPRDMLDYPARSFLQFFHNHGLLSVLNQPQWFTVVGGSREYVKRLTAPFAEHIKLNCGVTAVKREADGVHVTDRRGETHRYDQAVFATHADITLSLLNNPTQDEHRVLSAFAYKANSTVLHGDKALLPARRRAWASWIYRKDPAQPDAMCLHYWMNNLQPLNTKRDLFVTLNATQQPAEALDRHRFEHPQFNQGRPARPGRNSHHPGQGPPVVLRCLPALRISRRWAAQRRAGG